MFNPLAFGFGFSSGAAVDDLLDRSFKYRTDILFGVPIMKPVDVVKIQTPDDHWNGIRVIQSTMALQTHTAFDVVHNPCRRRRAYSVRKRTWTTPGCYHLSDGTLVVHPEVYAQMLKASAT